MGEAPSHLPPKKIDNAPDIPIEIVSDEEMALIEAALASARSLSFPALHSLPSPSFSPQFSRNAKSPVQSIILLSKRSLSKCTQPDIEDSGNLVNSQKRSRVGESYLLRFRKNRGLAVTDITSTEWCQKRMEFTLLYGAQKPNEAMRAGIARHTKLEEEVIKRIEVKVKSREDFWALKFINFINGVNQLQSDGLTRELPIIGFAEGVWMVGVIDEIRLLPTSGDNNPVLIDTKTRSRDSLPSEPQRRNGRLQLMCYKHLWDNSVVHNFPSVQFFDFFGLKPQQTLCEDLKVSSADSGFTVSTLDDMVVYYKQTCTKLASAHDQLQLRYESQKDHSLLGEDKFTYDGEWLKNQIQSCLRFWLGGEEASYAPEDERWKCRFCQYASVCPAYTDAEREEREECDTSSQ